MQKGVLLFVFLLFGSLVFFVCFIFFVWKKQKGYFSAILVFFFFCPQRPVFKILLFFLFCFIFWFSFCLSFQQSSNFFFAFCPFLFWCWLCFWYVLFCSCLVFVLFLVLLSQTMKNTVFPALLVYFSHVGYKVVLYFFNFRFWLLFVFSCVVCFLLDIWFVLFCGCVVWYSSLFKRKQD